MRMTVGTRNKSVPYLMLLILLIKFLWIFNKATQNHGSFYKMMNECRIWISIFLIKNGLLLNLQFIIFIIALLIFTMVRILFNTKIITENVKVVWYIPLILLMNNNFLIFHCVEYCVCYWLFVRPWKYNIRRNVNSDFSVVTMRRVAIIFFELGVVKNSMQKF